MNHIIQKTLTGERILFKSIIFGGNGNHFIRLNYACPKERLNDGLNRLKIGIEQFQKV